jgi:hypothetical protein
LGHIALGRTDFVLAFTIADSIALAVTVHFGSIFSRVGDPMQA